MSALSSPPCPQGTLGLPVLKTSEPAALTFVLTRGHLGGGDRQVALQADTQRPTKEKADWRPLCRLETPLSSPSANFSRIPRSRYPLSHIPSPPSHHHHHPLEGQIRNPRHWVRLAFGKSHHKILHQKRDLWSKTRLQT